MTVSERVKAHYEAHCGDGRPSLPVPEWGDDLGNGEIRPLIVYWKPFTLADHARCFAAEPGTASDARAYAKVVFYKAEDRAGARMFSELSDLHLLQHESDQSVVTRIANEIMAAPSLSEAMERLRADGLRMTMHGLADRLGKTIEEIERMSVAAFRETLAYHQVKDED